MGASSSAVDPENTAEDGATTLGIDDFVLQAFYGQERNVTKAYGDIHFIADKSSSYYRPRYVCIGDSDKNTDDGTFGNLKKLITDYWKRKEPKLVVSILGGLKNAASVDLERTCDLSDLAMASANGTWVLTPGTHVGVGKLIGSAVKDYIAKKGSAKLDDVVLLGIASYRCITHRESLCSWEKNANIDDLRDGKKRAYTAEYHLGGSTKNHGDNTQLIDPNHSLFVLVDDEGPNKFGGELRWRLRFEQFLARANREQEVPVVSVLLNGGETAVEACAQRLKSDLNVPLIVVKGSGGAADLIAELFENEKNKRDEREDLQKKTAKAVSKNLDYGKNNSEQQIQENEIMETEEIEEIEKIEKEIEELCKVHFGEDFKLMDERNKKEMIANLHCIRNAMKQMVLVLDASEIAERSALLLNVLRAVQMYFKKQQQPAKDTFKLLMELSLAWNKPPLGAWVIQNAESGDANSGSQGDHKTKVLCDVAHSAMVESKDEFVQMLLDNGLELSQLVSGDSPKKSDGLIQLYQKIFQRLDDPFARFINRRIQKRGDFEFKKDIKESQKTPFKRAIAKELEKYLENTVKINPDDLGTAQCYGHDSSKVGSEEKLMKSEKAAQQLFLWAILFNRIDLALLLWNHASDHIAGAIVAAVALKNLSRKAKNHEGDEICDQYKESSEFFIKLAAGVLEHCWANDRKQTSDLIIRVSHFWGGCTILGLSYRGKLEGFMAEPACASKLQKIMFGNLSITNPWKMIFLAAFIPLAVCQLKFVRSSSGEDRLDEKKAISGYQFLRVTPGTNKKRGRIGYWKAVSAAFSSPIVKCIHYTVYHLAFLVLFAIFMMTELGYDVQCGEQGNTTTGEMVNTTTMRNSSLLVCLESPYECLITFTKCHWAEMATMLCMGNNFVDELRQFSRSSGHQSYVKEWIRDKWNFVDLFAYILFIGANIARAYIDEEYFDVVLILYSIAFLLNIMRFYQLFYISERLGPKITMILGMLVDLGLFLVILLLAVVAFGIINQTILNPMAPFDLELLNKVLYRPYFQMYGELFLEDYEHAGEGYGYKWVILGLFMIVTNVLLLNLLIAMFSHTFENIQSKAEMLWKYNYYSVVYEHYDRPRFPLIEALIRLLIGCRRNCSGHKDSDFRRDFKGNSGGWCSSCRFCCKVGAKTNRNYDKELSDFARKRMEEYDTTRRNEDNNHEDDTSKIRFNELSQQMEQIRSVIEDLSKKVLAKSSDAEASDTKHSGQQTQRKGEKK